MNTKRLRKPLILALISANGIFFSSLAGSSETIPIGRLALGQERLIRNGVLVSRPSPIDERIAALVRQNQFQSINDYAAWLKKNVVYQPNDQIEQWPRADELLNSLRGDCKDFASLTSRVLKVLGYEPHILALMSRSSGHVICAFEYDGKIYWFDNADLKLSPSRSLMELSRELTEKFNYTQSFEVNLQSKENNLIYQRS